MKKTIDSDKSSVDELDKGGKAITINKVLGSEEILEGSKSTDSSIMFEASNIIDPEISNIQRDDVVEVQTNNNNQKVKLPHLVALDSTDETLTWQLDGLDPKSRIEKYQVNIQEKWIGGPTVTPRY